MKALWDSCLALCQQFRQTLPGEAKLHWGKTGGNKRREGNKVVQSLRLQSSKMQAKQEVEAVMLLISILWQRAARLETQTQAHSGTHTRAHTHTASPNDPWYDWCSVHWRKSSDTVSGQWANATLIYLDCPTANESVHVVQLIISCFKGN